jgi:hypothetical protein
MDWMDAEELATVVCEIPEETADSNAIEEALYEKFDCSFEQFHKIAEALEQFTIPAKAAISGELFRGFVHDGAFITRTSVPVPEK